MILLDKNVILTQNIWKITIPKVPRSTKFKEKWLKKVNYKEDNIIENLQFYFTEIKSDDIVNFSTVPKKKKKSKKQEKEWKERLPLIFSEKQLYTKKKRVLPPNTGHIKKKKTMFIIFPPKMAIFSFFSFLSL